MAEAYQSETLERPARGQPARASRSERVVSLARGDGVGPEITEATLRILEAAAVPVQFEPVSMGLECWNQGLTSGLPEASWTAVRESGVLLKGPMTTPQGSGMKSLNVTLRKSFGLYANVRPVRAYVPYVASHYPNTDIVIIRENEGDLYAGIEHRQSQDVVQCLKLVSRPGCERIIRYAFEYAESRKRKRLTCMTKDNIMKLTDGLFHEVFDEVAAEYPGIESDHMIVDIGMAKVAADPESFDVIVTPNLYGDIVSDIAAEVTGSVGLAPSANIGERISVFEAIHGSAPDIAGQNFANPSGLLLSAVKMLAHLGLGGEAECVHNAWLKTIEDGVHTPDIFNSKVSRINVGTDGFADAVIKRLGEEPRNLARVHYPRRLLQTTPQTSNQDSVKELVGVDIFVQSRDPVKELAERVKAAGWNHILELKMISNRGVQVWPKGVPETFCTDHWRCRFIAREGVQLRNQNIFKLAIALDVFNVDVIKTEHLYNFSGKPGFSMG